MTVLVGSLSHTHDGVRIAAAQALGKSAPHEGACNALLARVQQDGSWQARRAAAQSIARVCTLQQRRHVRAALEAILDQGGEVYSEVADMLKSCIALLNSADATPDAATAVVTVLAAAASGSGGGGGGVICSTGRLPVDNALFEELVAQVTSDKPCSRTLGATGSFRSGAGKDEGGVGRKSERAGTGGAGEKELGWSGRMFELLPPPPAHVVQRLIEQGLRSPAPLVRAEAAAALGHAARAAPHLALRSLSFPSLPACLPVCAFWTQAPRRRISRWRRNGWRPPNPGVQGGVQLTIPFF